MNTPRSPSPALPSWFARTLLAIRIRGAKALLAALGLALLSAVLLVPIDDRPGDSAGAWLEEAVGLPVLLKLRQQLRPIEPAPEVTIVEIDRADGASVLQSPDAEPRDWPRELHGRLVTKLHEAGARLVVFDSVFRNPQNACDGARAADGDRVFAGAMRATNNVLFAQDIDIRTEGPGGEAMIVRPVTSTELLEQAALNSAVNPIPELENRDHATRFFALSPYTGHSPTLPLTVLWHAWLRSGGDLAGCTLPDWGPAESERAHIQQLADWLLGAPECAAARLAAPDAAGLSPVARALFRIYSADEGDTLVINPYGPAGTIKTCSYLDVLSDEPVQGCDFKNKDVFVGFSANFQAGRNREIFKTVFGRVSMVELLATTYSNLLNDESIRTPDSVWCVLGVVLWAVVVGLIVGGCRSFMSALRIVGPLSVAYAVAAAALLITQDYWLWWVIPVLVVGAGGLLLRFALIFRPNYKGYGTVLGSDKENSTRVKSSLGDDKRESFLNPYDAELTRIAQSYQGVFANNDGGDQWFGFWKSRPLSMRGRRQACRAALKLAEFTERFPREFGVNMPLRIGLHFDNFEAVRQFNLDLPNFRWPTSDVSSIASRLEDAGKTLKPVPRILLSRAALPESLLEFHEDTIWTRLIPLFRPSFITRRLGVFEMKGLNAMEIHHLMACREDLDAAAIARLEGLRDRFEAALALWEQGNWLAAKTAFTALLEEHPDDGPTEFYLGLLGPEITARKSPVVVLKKSKE